MSTIAQDAHRYRLRQAEKLLDLFEDANGRPPKSTDELAWWVASPAGKAATAYDKSTDGRIIPD